MAKTIILSEQAESVQYLAARDKRLAKVIRLVGPISYSPYEDPFSFIVHEIIEQMLSIKAGATIYGRLKEMCGGSVTPQSICGLTEDQIHETGTSSIKARNIKSIAEAVITGKLTFSLLENKSDEEVIDELIKQSGIGNWTAKMYLIFVLNRQDVLPYEDVAFLQGYKWAYKTEDVSKTSIIKKCSKWKPYSSIAARYLYRALDMGLTKEKFHLYK